MAYYSVLAIQVAPPPYPILGDIARTAPFAMDYELGPRRHHWLEDAQDEGVRTAPAAFAIACLTPDRQLVEVLDSAGAPLPALTRELRQNWSTHVRPL